MKRIVLGLVVGGLVFGGVFAAASTLSVTSGSTQAGSGSVGQCDADGVTVSYGTPTFTAGTGYTLTQATVSGVSASCAGKTLYVTVADGSNGALQSQTASIPASSPPSSYTVTFGSAVSVASILNAHVAIN